MTGKTTNQPTDRITKKLLDTGMAIDREILLCEDREESVALACVMIMAAKRILLNCAGTSGLRKVVGELEKGLENEKKRK